MSDQVDNPLAEFPPEVRVAVDGILHLGQLEEDFEFCGHTFGLKTLKAGEEIAASAAITQYRNTIKEPDAWAAAQVGLALTHVDGEDDFCDPAGPDLVAFAKARFNYVIKNWYTPTILYLFQQYSTLLDRQIEAVRELQDLSERGPRISWPLGDSLNERGISLEQIDLDSLEPQS